MITTKFKLYLGEGDELDKRGSEYTQNKIISKKQDPKFFCGSTDVHYITEINNDGHP